MAGSGGGWRGPDLVADGEGLERIRPIGRTWPARVADGEGSGLGGGCVVPDRGFRLWWRMEGRWSASVL